LPAGQLNGNYSAITTVVNGNLTDANIKAAAAIALSKLSLTTPALNLQATNNPAWAAGVTGDTIARVQLNSNGNLQFGPGSSTALDTQIIRNSANNIGVYGANGTTLEPSTLRPSRERDSISRAAP
jgi:hypothetical protein